jgi:D-beta-D-heptose 7-phosphate kinase/D-beta-D-heptose 1-phosphate adenosyltransferase
MTSLNELKHSRVLIVGDVMLDRYWWGTVNRISPEAPVPVVRLDKSTTAAGGAGNVALNVAGLGASPRLIGSVGDDADAEALCAELSARGVDASSLIRLNGRPTSVKTRVIAHNQQVVRVDSENANPLSEEHERIARAAILESLSDAEIVVVSDYAKGFLTDGLLRLLIDECERRNTMILIDPKGKDYLKYKGATLLTPNRREAADACNLEESLPDLVQRSGEKLLAELSLEQLLITEGEHGMTLFQRGAAPVHIETAAKVIYDVTGAGDTVVAVLATALCGGFDFAQAAELANLAAGIVVEQVGTSVVTIERLKQAVAETVPGSGTIPRN